MCAAYRNEREHSDDRRYGFKAEFRNDGTRQHGSDEFAHAEQAAPQARDFAVCLESEKGEEKTIN